MNEKQIISEMLRSTERAGIENLLEYMEANGFFDAPCSSKYHLSERGGLAKHSLNVANYALALFDTFYRYTDTEMPFDGVESVIICALLHDLGKMGQFGKPAYIENEDPEAGAFKGNKELLYIPHEIRSIAIASQFIQLTEEEQFAILYHNGLYGELKSIKGSETPLYMTLHFADMWACRVIESEGKR